jgi:uncharacterized protein (TIGR03435 family)
MSPDAHASFEVATIKPSDPNSQRQGIDSKGRTLILLGQTLTNMMVFAYQLHKDQIVGGPAWISTDRYDIEGVPDTPGDPDLSQIQEMVRTLLADRFRLTFHHEQREMTYYAIVLAKGGSKLAKSAASDDNMPHQSLGGNARQKNAKFTNNQMSDFALCMQLIADRPVVDETGLKGRFDFTLRWQPNDTPSADVDAPPPLFTAMEEQLGLKLQPKRGPVDAFVIDKVARPSAN